jgi:uncharacterized membrane protein YgcG
MWFLLACSRAPAPEPITEVVTVETSEVSAADLNALQDRVDARLNALEERVGNLEMLMAEERAEKLADADQIGFDPSRTTLASHDLQGAVDELAEDVARLQDQSRDMGEPGQKLFEIPKDKPGQGGPGGKGGPGKGGPGGQGGQGGQGGPGGPGGQQPPPGR